eukprot:gene400-biopygen22600
MNQVRRGLSQSQPDGFQKSGSQSDSDPDTNPATDIRPEGRGPIRSGLTHSTPPARLRSGTGKTGRRNPPGQPPYFAVSRALPSERSFVVSFGNRVGPLVSRLTYGSVLQPFGPPHLPKGHRDFSIKSLVAVSPKRISRCSGSITGCTHGSSQRNSGCTIIGDHPADTARATAVLRAGTNSALRAGSPCGCAVLHVKVRHSSLVARAALLDQRHDGVRRTRELHHQNHCLLVAPVVHLAAAPHASAVHHLRQDRARFECVRQSETVRVRVAAVRAVLPHLGEPARLPHWGPGHLQRPFEPAAGEPAQRQHVASLRPLPAQPARFAPAEVPQLELEVAPVVELVRSVAAGPCEVHS